MLSLDRARVLGAQSDGLAVVVTTRPDGSAQASVVHAGVTVNPVTGEPVVAFVVRGPARKLTNLRARPRISVVVRAGWEWLAVEGEAGLAGPDDVLEGLDEGDVAGLLRDIYAAAVGGTPDQWRQLDQAMAAERHTAVLVRPTRIYSNPT